MTLDQLQSTFEIYGASLQMHYTTSGWTVWLYAPDDPEAAFFQATAPSLRVAVQKVIAQWAHCDASN
jgi:hypothetical protein